ncbi:MAG: uroporphyrinogen-III C-methyltransferase [Thermodesulfobacteriota bacterium]|nr:uroporphyrinogen-III C-methyltransferase [Thermodesulfobacteriota bacterium]
MNTKNGKVYLVGAGPGDPGLLTIKGRECIRQADVVVYDYLASPSLLKYADENAEIIYAGKQGGSHTMSQDQINALLAEKAAQGLTVARLKGGDPFIFGRGGEEVEALIQYHCQNHNDLDPVDFEIVPGVTSAIAAPAYAGIPLTHREHTSSVSFITGHEDPARETSRVNWKSFARSTSTLVFLMGVKNLPFIVENLVKNGKSPDTPAALVRWGTTPRQKTITGTLANIVESVETARLKPPAVIIVGSVVSLRQKMKWFEKKPLLGKSIVVTRARSQASDLVTRLEALGASCLEAPAIDFAPPDDNTPLENSIHSIKEYHWLIFTSVNGVSCFFNTLFALGKDVRVLGHLKLACIGPATRDRLRDFGLVCDILPKTYRAESVVEAFSTQNLKNKKILLPRALEARSVLPVELSKMGADVFDIAAYKTVQASDNQDTLLKALEDKKIDMVTFTSSSTVKNFVHLLPGDPPEDLLSNVTFASIGPITTQTAEDLGISIDISADTYTIPGLVSAIHDHAVNSRRKSSDV